MVNIDMNSFVTVNGGKSMNMAEFAEKFGLDLLNPTMVVATANVLQKQGKLLVKETKSKEEQIVEKALTEEVFNQVVNDIDAQEEKHKQYKRAQKLQETDTHSFNLLFVTTLEATKFELWVNSLGIKQTAQFEDEESGAIKLFIKEVSPQEYTKITTKYKAEKAINAGVNVTSKAVNNTTNAVNYGLTNVVAPVAKIAGEAGMNIGKGLFHTLVKTGAGLVNSGAKAVVDTKLALTTDPECLRATKQLNDTKNALKRGVARKMNQTGYGSGIEIV